MSTPVERKCFEPNCDRPPTKRVIIEHGGMVISILMCGEHAAEIDVYPKNVTVSHA